MTFEGWLSEATGTFPAGVQARMAQEFTSHWEESGSGDPVTLFGKPRAVRRALKRSYFTAEEFGFVNGAGEWVFWAGMVAMAACAVIQALSWLSVFNALTTVLAFVACAVIWIVSRRWSRTRRAAVRLSSCLLAALIPLPEMLSGDTVSKIMGTVLLALLVLMLWLMPREDARLRRTLELQGGAA
jgi:hypothetical protein